MDLMVEGQDQEWSDDEYQPVVLKLEVHFAAPKRKQLLQPKKKNNQRGGGAVTTTTTTWNQTNFSTGSSGFIHLFLPISMTVAAAADSAAASSPLRTSTTSVRPVPAAATAAPVSGAEMTVTQRPTAQTFKRVNSNKKKKKKKAKRKKKKKKKNNNNKIHQQPIDESSSSNTMDSAVGDVTASVVDQRYKPMQASPSNRLMPLLLHDDGIPPMLNSLSSDETQQWARWLRCTLCLKVMRHNCHIARVGGFWMEQSSSSDSLICLFPYRTTENSRMRNPPCVSCRMSSVVKPTSQLKMN